MTDDVSSYLLRLFSGVAEPSVAVALAGASLLMLLLLIYESKLGHHRTGVESFIGEVAHVATPLGPHGKVRFQGTFWSARCAVETQSAGVGEVVRVVAVDGLCLIVEPASTKAV